MPSTYCVLWGYKDTPSSDIEIIVEKSWKTALAATMRRYLQERPSDAKSGPSPRIADYIQGYRIKIDLPALPQIPPFDRTDEFLEILEIAYTSIRDDSASLPEMHAKIDGFVLNKAP